MPTGLVVLIVIAVACALVAHWRIRGFWWATLASGPATALVFLAVSTVQGGFPDPFRPIVLVYFAGLGWIVAAQVGAAFVLARHRRRELA